MNEKNELENINIEDTEFWKQCGDLYHLYTNLSLSLMRMGSASGQHISTVMCVGAVSLLKSQGMSKKEIDNFIDNIIQKV
tara:strand:+ start:731 stop:970 length:240 start_codon:yes stop_codon:yes gene_type:complete